jgi:hypothetical protein
MRANHRKPPRNPAVLGQGGIGAAIERFNAAKIATQIAGIDRVFAVELPARQALLMAITFLSTMPTTLQPTSFLAGGLSADCTGVEKDI